MAAESPTSELPFRPEDLAQLTSPVEGSPLSGGFLDNVMQHFVACNPHVTAIPSGAWSAGELGENTLPCDDSSIFVLSVDINQHPACIVVHVAQRKAKLLPEPFNNWDDHWTTQPDPSLQQCDSRDSDIYYIWIIMHIASGLQVPPSFNGRLPLLLYCI
jgi:hypothetical protein